MAVTFATLGVDIDGGNAVVTARKISESVDDMGARGERAATRISQSTANMTASLYKQADALKMSSGGFMTVEQAMEAETSAALRTQYATANLGTTHKVAAEAAEGHRLAIGRINLALEGLAFETLGANAKLGSIATKFAEFGVGGIATGGLLAGLAAVSYAWEKFTEKEREAQEQNDKLIKSIGDMANAADAAKINAAGRNLLYGTPFDEKGHFIENSTRVVGAFKGSLADMEAEYADIMSKIPKDASMVSGAIGRRLDELVPQLDAARKAFHEVQLAANNLASQPVGIPGQIDPVAITAQSNAAILQSDDKLRKAEDALVDAGVDHLRRTLDLVRDMRQKQRDASLTADEDARQKAENQFYDSVDREIAAQKAADEKVKADQDRMLQSMRREFSRFFDDVLHGGIRSFKDLWSAGSDLFDQFISDLAAKQLTDKFGTALAGMFGVGSGAKDASLGSQEVGAGIVGFGAGYGVGEAINQGRGIGAAAGAAAGAASGAAIGSLGGPIGIGMGALIGGITGLVGGFLGGAHAAEEAKRQTDAAREAFTNSFGLWVKASEGQSTALDESVAQIRAQKDAYDEQIKTAYAGKAAESERNQLLQENAVAEQRAIDLARKRQAEQDAYDLADLQARALAAAGNTEAAQALSDATAQQHAYNDAVNAGKNASYLAQLAIVQQMETTAKSIAKVQGVIDGFSNTIGGLQQFKDSLALSAAPTDQARLAEAQRQYDAIVHSALTGDQTAAGNLPQAAQTLLDAAQAVYKSTSQYQDILATVNQDTDATIQYYQDQRSLAQQQLDALTAILKTESDALVAIQHQDSVITDAYTQPTGGQGRTPVDDGSGNGGPTGQPTSGGGDTGGGTRGDLAIISPLLGVSSNIQSTADRSDEISSNTAASVAVSAAGFQALIAAVQALAAKVDANTVATRQGLDTIAATVAR